MVLYRKVNWRLNLGLFFFFTRVITWVSTEYRVPSTWVPDYLYTKPQNLMLLSIDNYWNTYTYELISIKLIKHIWCAIKFEWIKRNRRKHFWKKFTKKRNYNPQRRNRCSQQRTKHKFHTRWLKMISSNW